MKNGDFHHVITDSKQIVTLSRPEFHSRANGNVVYMRNNQSNNYFYRENGFSPDPVPVELPPDFLSESDNVKRSI